jgi:hypothetical protein
MCRPVNLFSFGLIRRKPDAEVRNRIRFARGPSSENDPNSNSKECCLQCLSNRSWNIHQKPIGEYLFTIDRILRRVVTDSTYGGLGSIFCASDIHFLRAISLTIAESVVETASCRELHFNQKQAAMKSDSLRDTPKTLLAGNKGLLAMEQRIGAFTK